jgi:hypothetical protein
VGLQVTFFVKGPLAILIGTNEVFGSNVDFQMHVKLLLSAVALRASHIGALECLELVMSLEVIV